MHERHRLPRIRRRLFGFERAARSPDFLVEPAFLPVRLLPEGKVVRGGLGFFRLRKPVFRVGQQDTCRLEATLDAVFVGRRSGSVPSGRAPLDAVDDGGLG